MLGRSLRRLITTSAPQNSLLGSIPRHVRIVEMGPRDGLQNERAHGLVSWEDKVRLIGSLAGAGLTSIESGAFVSPKWVPLMAESGKVLRAARSIVADDVSLPVLVPNERGYEEALAAGATEIAIFGSASESFAQSNINTSIAGSLERFAVLAKRAQEDGVRVRGYVSCIAGCPFEGYVPPSKVAYMVEELLGLGCYEVSLGDTIGVGTPGSTGHVLDECLKVTGPERLAVHYHDTYGQALANVLVALEKGVASVDSSVAGLGGCPYAPSASGNLATENLVYMLHGMGVETGVDLRALVRTAEWICSVLDRRVSAHVSLAMLARMKRESYPV